MDFTLDATFWAINIFGAFVFALGAFATYKSLHQEDGGEKTKRQAPPITLL